jgi:uncharacterized protein YhaN
MLAQSLGRGGVDDKIEFWIRNLERRLDELVEDNTLPYDERRERELVESIAELDTAVAQTDDALKAGRQALRDLESRMRNSGIADPESVVCRTSGELRRLKGWLYEFVGSVVERRDDARLALTILEEIEVEEKTKVVELFGRDKSVSTYFKRITGGKYVEVKFDPEAVVMSVRNPVGDWVSANELSGGTLDQLYLVIRLSIAESMLGEGRGFFILDDPFVKSDVGRLKNQLQLLKNMVSDGWQVLYFSAKKEVYDLLKSDILAHDVQLIDLDDTLTSDVPPLPRPAAQPSADLFSDGPTY